MSKGGGGGGTSTTVQKADPWSGVQPGLKQLYAGAGDWFNNQSPEYYPNPTRAGMNNEMRLALNSGWSQSAKNMGDINTATSQLQQTGAGTDPNRNPANAAMQQFTNGQNIGTNPAQYMLQHYGAGKNIDDNPAIKPMGQFGRGDFMGGNTANPYMQDSANGKFLTEQTNPYLKGLFENATNPMVDQFKNATAPGLASQFSAAGRTGSGAHQSAFTGATDSLGRGLAGAASSIYGGAYENERQRQQQNIGMLSNNYNTERAMQMQGAQGYGSLYDNAFNRQLQGANSLASLNQGERANQLQAAQMQTGQYGMERGLQQQAQLSLPQMQQGQQQNLSQLLGIGEYGQNQDQQAINDDRAKWEFGQNKQLNKLQAYNQILQGGSAYAGSTSTGNQNQQRNPFASALGGAAAVNGLGGMLGGGLGTALTGGWGALGGALLGGLFG